MTSRRPRAAAVQAEPKAESKALHRTFEIGLILKGLDGILEVIGGILLLIITPRDIVRIVHDLTMHELSEDPHDFIARSLVHATGHLTGSATTFGAIYLLSHGVAKVALVALVLKRKLWAYPWLIVLLIAFIVYQIYRISAVRFSWGLTALTIFDAALVWLTWREYQVQKANRTTLAAPTTRQ
ncbi:MAG: DUF2127 domain-containing protein [Nocardiopsaceae bacterium]|jgi:uncharacterized membrane protein|nr:DUF2127 domain-containing protein [Nocardiopsaceae bacterium]